MEKTKVLVKEYNTSDFVGGVITEVLIPKGCVQWAFAVYDYNTDLWKFDGTNFMSIQYDGSNPFYQLLPMSFRGSGYISYCDSIPMLDDVKVKNVTYTSSTRFKFLFRVLNSFYNE